MIAIAYTVAFEGVEGRLVEVQCSVAPGLPSFTIVGLADKAVSEARDRLRAAFASLSIALPARRITVNLSPADLPKEGSHFDLPIALAVLAAIDILPREELSRILAIGELALDGRIVAVTGALPAAMTAAEDDRALLCPYDCGAEAAWISTVPVYAARSLRAAIDHIGARAPIARAHPGEVSSAEFNLDLSDVRGQERARRALEISASGRHHLLMSGPPGSGKSMLAKRLPGILPKLSPAEALETSMIYSLIGGLKGGEISRNAPFCEPHHTASMAAIIGGGRRAHPGQISLAHNGVLFLDELPEFPRSVLDTLRQPIETGEVVVARANAHIRYPCRFLLVAAANPCRCGYLSDPNKACGRVPLCAEDYMKKVSGPLMDRFDLRVDVPAVSLADLEIRTPAEGSTAIAARVADAREIQRIRYQGTPEIRTNSDLYGKYLDEFATPVPAAQALLLRAAERFGFTARGYHRVLRTARTIADLDGSSNVRDSHIAEAVGYRLPGQA